MGRGCWIAAAVVSLGLMGAIGSVAESASVVLEASRYGVRGDVGELVQTDALQRLLDMAGDAEGGGRVIVRLPPGRIVTGALTFSSDDVWLEIPAGTTLAGSPDWRDYGEGGWRDALLRSRGRQGIGLVGEGTLDGGDVENPHGEQNYRGPHAMCFLDCTNLVVRGITIARAGNYAFYGENLSRVTFEEVRFRAGHDGIHIQACENVSIRGCDFRTADDCIAGADNRTVRVEHSRFSTACNAFRLGVDDLHVRASVFQGPGEYDHKLFVREGAPRRTMLSAFTHFAPPDRHPKLPSDRWLIEDCWMDRVMSLYTYNHAAGLWQNGQPAKRIVFRNVHATNLTRPLEVVGDPQRSFDLTLDHVSLSLAPEAAHLPVIDLFCFHALRLHTVRLQNNGSVSLLRARVGNHLSFSQEDKLLLQHADIDDIRERHLADHGTRDEEF